MGWEDKVVEKSKKPTKVRLHEGTFKADFITTFLATWCAERHTNYCMAGKHAELADPPIEDAEELANDIWKSMIRNGLA